MGETARTQGRRYGGRDAAQRQEERRARLVAAGVELFGTAGYAATSVRAVCQQARLTERYFYETAHGREDLLAMVYDEIVREVQTASFTAARQAPPRLDAQVRAGLGHFVHALIGDPRKARIMLVEVVGASPRLEVRRHQVIHEFAQFIAALGKEHVPDADMGRLSLTAIALVGGVNELLVARALKQTEDDTYEAAEILDVCTALFLAALPTVDDRANATSTRSH